MYPRRSWGFRWHTGRRGGQLRHRYQGAQVVIENWPEDAPRWEPYLCWQIGKTDIDCVEELKGFAAAEFEERHGYAPDFTFYRLRAIYAGPVKAAIRE